MQFQKNFFPLTENRLLDPVLKVAIQRGRFDLDYSTVCYDVEFDPDLRPDRLWQKLPEKEIQLRVKGGMLSTNEYMVPFRSPNNRMLTYFFIKETYADGELILDLIPDAPAFTTMRNYLARSDAGPMSDHPEEFIDYVIHAMAEWYGSIELSPCEWKKTRLKFLIPKSFAQHLPSCKGRSFEEDDARNIVFDRRLLG